MMDCQLYDKKSRTLFSKDLVKCGKSKNTSSLFGYCLFVSGAFKANKKFVRGFELSSYFENFHPKRFSYVHYYSVGPK